MKIFTITAIPVMLSIVNATNITALFKASLSPKADIFYRTDPYWTTEVTQRWTYYKAPGYYAAIKPATAADIQATIKIAAENHIPFMVTGGGHSNTISAEGLNGIQIDMSAFNETSYNVYSKTVTVGGGVVFGQVIKLLAANGREIQTGSDSCVGMVGATLGGGVGRLQGLHGMIIDALLSVKIITAQGDIITATRAINSDLFWGLRGAGMNFGVVISATYQTHPATNGGQFTNADFVFPASSNVSYWKVLESFENNMPAPLSFTINIAFNATTNQPAIAMNAVYAGPQAEAEQILTPFIENNPIRSNISTIPYSSINKAALFGLADSRACQGPGTINLPLSNYALGLKRINSTTFTTWFADVANLYQANPALRRISLTVQRLATQAVLAVPDIDTAYGHRNIAAHLIFINGYDITNTTLTSILKSYMTHTIESFQATSGFAKKSIYVNYAHGDEGPSVWYTDRKLALLKPLKKKWDATNLFNWTNPI